MHSKEDRERILADLGASGLTPPGVLEAAGQSERGREAGPPYPSGSCASNCLLTKKARNEFSFRVQH